MRFLNAILIKLCLGFVLGIYLGFVDGIELRFLVYSSIFLLALLIIFRWVWKSKLVFLYSSILLFMVLGCLTTYVHLPNNQQNHLINFNFGNFDALPVKAVVSEILRPNDYNHKFILNELTIDDQAYRGKILWQVSKDADISSLFVGQEVLLFSELHSFQKPRNPQYFDYAGFMKNRNVFAIINEDHFEIHPHNDISFIALSADYRRNIVLALKKAGFEDTYLDFMQALILGQKQAINKDTYNNFAEVGVVHILAVSGLHVGIVLIIIQFLLRPIRYLSKYGRSVMVVLSIIGLWGFAALAGFSPSVMRASTMFTFLALGQLSRRKSSSVNMLCLSAVVLLLIKPQFLFEVGFQLSYAAVFSIVMLYPVFSKLYQPTYKLPKLFVDTAYVSIAAQIGVLPFQLFYFHQFPGLFLLANIVVIPFLGILLSGGILCILLSLIGILVSPLVRLYATFLDVLIGFVDWLSAFKASVIQNIFFTTPMFISILVMVFFFILMIRDFKVREISIFLTAALAFSLVTVYEMTEIDKKSEFIIFYKYKASVIGVKQNTNLKIFSDASHLSEQDYFLKNYCLLNRIKTVEPMPLTNSFKIGSKHLLRIDSTGFYSPKLKADIVLLSESPDIHLGKLISQLKPEKIITDSKNYRTYVERWQLTAKQLEIPFHNVYTEGFISFSLP